MKSAASLKGKLKQLAKEKDINASILMQNYMFERFLDRVSNSNYKRNFVIKGGMLISSIFGVDLRATRDLDATIKGIKINKVIAEQMINDIIRIDLKDNIVFTINKIESIRLKNIHEGYKISLVASFEGINVFIDIDITTGDEITYKEISYEYKTMLDNEKIKILAYNNETIIAEKYETIISRNISNTRMKDFYDLYLFLKIKWELSTLNF